ncbi:MAG: carboxypeptidase-like regulatory domain-containing protein [Acidobacteriota bacterium]|nr:carboxypeptidase-like regulatory domain-containing protein [Acidobacteriota bacterium]
MLLCSGRAAHAQTTGSIEGTVRDPSGAVIPKAEVSLVEQSTRARRTAVSNGQGDFAINAVSPGTYDLTVKATGFDRYRIQGIDLHPGDQKTIATIALKVGETTTEVTVSAAFAGVTLDSPEKSALITSEDIKRLSTVGRDATELIKFLPGFAVSTGGTLNNSSTGNSNQNMGFGSSSVSSFSANGATPQTGASTVISDGAATMDPGDQGASIQNVNMDMVQEIKVQTSNFGADSAKGPVVINAVGKSGGSQFHGTAYLFARNGQLNSNDWYSNYQAAARPPTSYFYPGGNIGGPVLIPGTNFNHNKKLRFFTAFEYYKQTLFYGLLQSFIPTARMLSGDLTPASIAQALNVNAVTLQKTCPNFYTTNGGGSGAATLNGSGGICYSPGTNGTTYTQQDQIISSGVVVGGNGLLPVDPRALIYAKFWPAINRTPQPVPASSLLSDGYNYQNSLTNTANGYQYQGRIDEDFTDNTKLNVTYKLEKSNYQEPVKNEYYAGSDIIPYPTPEYSQTKSNGVSLNFTKSFGATMTNEFVAAGILYSQPANFANSSLVQDSSTGWTGGRFYNNGAHQIPGIIDYENGTPDFAMAYDPVNGGKFLHKFSYNFGDNLTRQVRSHTVKLGVYFETSGNNQLPYNFTQGENTFNHYNSGCATNDGLHTSQLQNNIANFLQGCSGFSQASASNPENLRYRTFDLYATDTWKATSKLTLTLGIRFDHLGAWYSPDGIGLAVWNAPAQHTRATLTQDPHSYPGISWHQTDASVPLSGQPTRPVFYSPRVGLAYDLYGNGHTTFRGGFGYYRFHDSYNDSAGALDTSLGGQSYSTPNNTSCTYDQITGASQGNSTLGTGCVPISGSSSQAQPISVTALNPHDDRQPLTYNYNLTVDQVMPFGGNLEMSYVGNQSHDTFTAGNLRNQNFIPLGGLFQPDPLTGAVTQAGSSQQVTADYRPYPYYSGVYVPNHIGYGNYNSLQVSYNKQKGAFIFGLNYTWSKALGIRGDYRTGAIGDPSNLRNDYGYLGFNRTQIVNATYSWQVGRLYTGNRLLAAVVNQWEFSGITGLQSGPDIAVLTGGGNFSLSANVSYTPAGSTTPVSVSTGNSAFLGTPDISLQPIVKCNPKSNLHDDSRYGRQYFNGSCFALPQYGSNGAFELPDIHGPAYFNSDLTLRRSFHIRDKQSLQFSLAGFNFLNHPLPAFAGGNNIGLSLGFGNPVGSTPTTPQEAFAAAVQTTANFGYTPYKQGYRIVELGARFNF